VLTFHFILDRGLLLTMKKMNQWFLVSSGQVEVITSNVLQSQQWLGWPLRNYCVTTYHGYCRNHHPVLTPFKTHHLSSPQILT